ncbi:MAG: hypothetical protein KAH20_15945 [Methylococcales bacterium]|nr:hypothetical protein [Methylococcales bacterium]
MKRFINQFGQDRIKGLLADHEFIGDNWMDWLIEEKIPFNIQICNNSYGTGLQLFINQTKAHRY